MFLGRSSIGAPKSHLAESVLRGNVLNHHQPTWVGPIADIISIPSARHTKILCNLACIAELPMSL